MGIYLYVIILVMFRMCKLSSCNPACDCRNAKIAFKSCYKHIAMSSVAEIYEIALFMIHQIFFWAGDQSKLVTSLYIPQLFP